MTAPISHNNLGQKLGRKGQETRERIISAMLSLLADEDGPPLTWTGVAKEASVRPTNLYLYFPDMAELLLAALGRVMATAEDAYVARLRERWPDEALHERCLEFLRAHHAFWRRHARILHMRNAMADAADLRVLLHRNTASMPLIGMLLAQMDCGGETDDPALSNVATVLLTGLERIATVVTNPNFSYVTERSRADTQAVLVPGLLEAEAEVMTTVIGARRRRARADRG